MTCLSCEARWSRKTGLDDIQVKMGLITEQPQSTHPCPGCASTTRLQQMTNKTETFFGCSRFPLCKRVVYTSLTAESRVSPSAHSCSAGQPTAEQVMVLDSDSVGSEESFRMLNVPAVAAVSQQAIVRMFPDQQQKIKVSKAVRTLQETMQKCRCGKAVDLMSAGQEGTRFAGRRVVQNPDFRITVSMDEYVKSKLRPIEVLKDTCQTPRK